MKHQIVGYYSLSELKEIINLVLENQETIDRHKNTYIQLSGQLSQYDIEVDFDGNCRITKIKQ